jgi:uncharacterized membrane protein YukC
MMKNEKEVSLFVPADKFQINFSAAALLRVIYALLVIFLGYQWYSVSAKNDDLTYDLHHANVDYSYENELRSNLDSCLQGKK